VSTIGLPPASRCGKPHSRVPHVLLGKRSFASATFRRPVRTVLALILAAAASAAPGDAARPRPAGRIVFASERGSTLENSKIVSVRADGSRRRVLSPPLGGDGGARWSPDGTRVAFWGERSQGGLVQALYVMRSDGRARRRVTPVALRVPRDFDAPSWSPDGARLAFSATDGSRFGIWTVRVDGRGLRFLARGGVGAAWSPREDRIAFARPGGISLVSPRGGAMRRLTRGPNDSSPAWSPDGGTIAFVRSDANGITQALDVVPASGGPVRRIFGGARGVTMGRSPQWSPSGRLIAFEANAGVYVVRVRDRAVRRLRRHGDWPAWSPDGRRIAFTSGSSIYVMQADGSRVRRVRAESRSEFGDGPVWSPEGTTLLYVTTPSESDFELFSVRADGSELRQLTRNAGEDLSPAWSPLRRRIAFARRGWIWVMNVDGTGERRLFPGGQPSWSPDGSRFAYAAAGVVSIRSLRGGAAERIADGYGPAWSPDGAEVAFVRGTRLLAVDVRSRRERTIADAALSCPEGNDTSLARPDWSPDGRRLLFVVVCDALHFATASAEVVAADGSGRRVLRIDAELAPSALAWSPDGTRVAFVSDAPRRRLGTIRLDGTGRAAVVADAAGAAYLDPDW
jgi:Tol biopolymer transport system component